MRKFKSFDEFNELKDRLIADQAPYIPTIIIPAGTCGQASGANDLIRITKREILARELTDHIRVRITGCHGFCEMEPSILVEPYRTFYPNVVTDDMVRIVKAVAKGEVLKDLLFKNPETGEPIEKQDDIPFYKKQVRTLLSKNEKVDPIRIFNYIVIGGYTGMVNVLEKGDPKKVVEEVKASRLRGRGGAGFPTGLKWELLANARNGKDKFIVCNADEGDPGAYMDRSLLEGNPHSIIEGMTIGAYGTGAKEGYIYVRNEYPLAIKHLVIALRQAREIGFLGKNILGTDFSFDINLVRGAGAFVCGEETALMRSIEGKMGEPRQRPPFPVEKGIYGSPTIINNVETWTNIPMIIVDGAEKFVKVGQKNNTGTKIFSLVGKIKNTGLVEVPMGITIKEIVYDIGGGPVNNSKFKAVQTGGPSGGCIPAEMFDLQIDYDSLKEIGSIMGSGGMIVMDEHTCMIDIAKYFMTFLKDESCGKCFTCRKGTQRMYEILDDISKGQGTIEKLDLLEELAHVVQDSTMCGLGQSTSNPVLSTLKYFRDEYEKHIKQKQCDAFACKELIGTPCASACPLGTKAWRYIAHIERGEYEDAYCVIREANPFPSVCARVCNHPCEDRCRAGTSGGQSVAIRALKRFITDRIDPEIYKPERIDKAGKNSSKIAIIGSGPAGLTAAHYLSLKSYNITVFEAGQSPGGMLLYAIPEYRLPHNVIQKEIKSLLDENITLKFNTALGKEISIDGLFDDGYSAVFLAIGAHKSRRLNIEGEDVAGVYPSIQFLKSFNTEGESLARGDVGVIGGGNSAIDAARMAIRQDGVKSVTIFYRRSRQEMPALEEEIEAAVTEGIEIRILLTPIKIASKENHVIGIECIRNKLGEIDSSGRRKPVQMPGTEHYISLDTLIVAISEGSDTDCISMASSSRIETTGRDTVKVDPHTLCTNREGVFAGGDVVSGPNTVIDAIADGKKAATIIDRYIKGEDLVQPVLPRIPEVYIEASKAAKEQVEMGDRAKIPRLLAEQRKHNFSEVEVSMSEVEATQEARRCLRCDLEFTLPKGNEAKKIAIGENVV
ncbi:MAG: NADH-quinone oxidoreductase subunit NuoF [Candidatus Marinimicrobia bacterium]|nr:NADH-quinone oxidoreductase subunit NuoF [Candidatus Neomarinimicrobiota bacterium]